MIQTSSPAPNGGVRCAIYTRKSTDEGLDQDFNSLDAQRESAEAYCSVSVLALQRLYLRMMRFADAVQTKGLGVSLLTSMYS